MENNLIRIFNGTDYPGWAREMTWYLKDRDLWEVVEKNFNDIEGDKEKLKKKDSTAMSKIGLHLDRDIQRHVMECETANEAWQSLSMHFKSKSKKRSAKMLFQLISNKHDESEPVTNFVLKQRELYSELKEIGIDISEDILKISILKGLSKSFENIRDTILNEKTDEIVDYDELKTRLHEFEQDKEMRESPTEGKAFNSIGEIICDNCGKPGHKWRKCRKKLKDYLQRRKDNYSRSKPEKQVNEITMFTAMDDEINHAMEQKEEELTWILDSGATNHITGDRNCFVTYQTVSNGVVLPDGSRVISKGRGEVNLDIISATGTSRVKLLNVLYIPDIKKNIMSVTTMIANGARLEMSNDSTDLIIKDNKGKRLITAKLKNRLYTIRSTASSQNSLNAIGNEDKVTELYKWHCRLGHMSDKYVKEIVNSDAVDGVPTLDAQLTLPACDSCLTTKNTRKPFNGTRPETIKCLERVHSDFAGPIDPPTPDGHIGYVSFIDDYSNFQRIYLVKAKYEIFDRCREYKAWAENITGNQLKALRVDNGGEYHSHRFQEWAKKQGIEVESTAPYSPQQNGVAERFNRTVLEMARAMMKHSGLNKILWGEAIKTSVVLLNFKIPPNSKRKVTPFQLWNGRAPNLRNLRVFGSDCYVHVPKEKRKKLDDTAEKCKLIGYSISGYRVINQKGRIFISRDVEFNEETVIAQSMQSYKINALPNSEAEKLESINPGGVVKEGTGTSESGSSVSNSTPSASEYTESTASETTPPITPPRRSERIQSKLAESVRKINEGDESQGVQLAMCLSVSIIEEPNNYEEAMNSEHKDNWKEAMDQEYQSLMKNNTWELVELPKGKKLVSTKWVYKYKSGNSSNPPRFKARLVARGFLQRKGIDFEEVYSPTLKYTTLRLVLGLALENKMHIHNLDIKTAFLNGTLEEEVYVSQPKGYVEKENEEKVCRLKKALYGLKQAPRAWNKCFYQVMNSLGFNQSKSDNCLYFNFERECILVVVYVDDIVIASKSLNRVNEFKASITTRFEAKDMGELTSVLGVEIDYSRDKGTMSISQEVYIERVLEQFGFKESRPVGSPSQPGQRLTSSGIETDSCSFRQAVGSLMYCMLLTRPDLAYPVSEVSRFVEKPTQEHWNALKRIFKYLRGSSNCVLKYARGTEVSLQGYCDADFASDPIKRRSQTGYLFRIGNNTISWKSVMQKTVALSTVEAEYLALSDALKEGLWLQQLLMELKIPSKNIIMFEDNTGTIAIAKNPMNHGRTKHIDVRHHFIREHVMNENVVIKHCPTDKMIADALTKGLHPNRFKEHRIAMGVVSQGEC